MPLKVNISPHLPIFLSLTQFVCRIQFSSGTTEASRWNHIAVRCATEN